LPSLEKWPKSLHNRLINQFLGFVESAEESDKAYYTIGEVAELLEVNTSLIRFWEKEFKQLKPNFSKNGHRRYSKADITLIRYIQYLSKEKGLTLDGVKQALKNETVDNHQRMQLIHSLTNMRDLLVQMRELIKQHKKT
jgi:DNA-binding transcriptional MerR regulator